MTPELQAAFTAFLVAALSLLVAIVNYIAVQLGAAAAQKRNELKIKVGSDQYNALRQIVVDLVKAAQAIYPLKTMLSDRRKYVIDQAQKLADQYKIPVSVDSIVSILEAAITDGVNHGWGSVMTTIKATDPAPSSNPPATEPQPVVPQG